MTATEKSQEADGGKKQPAELPSHDNRGGRSEVRKSPDGVPWARQP